MGRKFAAVVFSLGCLQASSALALGLGELELESFLNEPLDASVDLLNTGNLHPDEIKVRLATREDFSKLGIDRAYFLTSIQFNVVVEGGQARIVMTTDDPVLEPYLDFVVEARWPSGRLLREYTVLIDPPAFSQATPVVSASQRVEEVEGIPAPGKKKQVDSASGTKVDVRKSNLGPGEMPQRDFNASAETAPLAGNRYMIKRDDTLWTIASRAKPSGATVHQTMLDIQRMNPDAFINNNINRVKAGYIIYLPTAADISSADVESALAEVRAQNDAWREGRDAELAATARPSLKISAEEEEQSVADLESRGAAAALEDELARSDEALSDSDDRVLAMEGRVETLERIVDLKDEQISALQAALAKARAQADVDEELVDEVASEMDDTYETIEPVESLLDDDVSEAANDDVSSMADEEVDAEAAMAEDMAEETAEDTADTAASSSSAPTKSASTSASTKDSDASGGIMDYLWYIVGAIALAIVGFIVARMRNRDDEDDEPTQSADVFSNVQLKNENLDIAEADLDDEDDEPDVPTVSPIVAAASPTRGYGEGKNDGYASDVDAADALAEADIYIAYGRHRQAIELLNNALASEPNNPVYRLKLMEIHTELNDRAEASEQLHQLRSIGDEDSIAQGEELLASMDNDGSAAPESTASEDTSSGSNEPGLEPNPFAGESDADGGVDFAGLEIEDGDDDGEEDDLDLSADFSDEEDDDEELVIAADANGMSTKLDLARAYIDMGDDDGARQILEEVVAEGGDDIKAEAQELLDRIG